jgi:hypothetical protein
MITQRTSKAKGARKCYVLANGKGQGYWCASGGRLVNGGHWTADLARATRYTRADMRMSSELMRAGVGAPGGIWLTQSDADAIEHPRGAPDLR